MRRPLSLLLAVLVAAAAPARQPAYGQSSDRQSADRQSLGGQSIDALNLRGGQARQSRREVYRAQAETLAEEVEALRDELVRLGRSQAVGEGRAARERDRLDDLQSQEVALRESLGRNRTQLARLLGALQLYQRDPPPPLFVHARSARNAARAAVLMQAVTPELERRGKVLAARRDAIRRVRRQATAASETLLLTESEMEERRSRIERLIAQKTTLERRLLADADVADAAARVLAAGAGSLGELVQGLEARESRPAPTAFVRLVQPVQGRLVKRFGDRSGRSQSEGVTWRTQAPAQVLAPTNAKVEYVGPLKGYGLIVILRPGGSYHVVLAGLDQAASGAGRTVAAGEPIGRMSDGGSELYLEVRRGGEPVDPARWLAPSQKGRQRRG